MASGIVILLFAEFVFAQGTGEMKDQQCGVTLVKLSPPVFAPLARQARIGGDVVIQLAIGRDGKVESANVVSGHPMLKQGALESAQNSTFECRCCAEGGNPYTLTYTFGFRDDDGDSCGVEVDEEWHVRSFDCLYLWRCKVVRTYRPRQHKLGPDVTQSQNHVTVMALPVCVQTDISH
jgi:TonB family protein